MEEMFITIREEFLTDWVKNATSQEIVEKLIKNDERAKKIKELEKERDYYKKLYNESNDWLFDYDEFKESKHIPRID